MQELTGTVESEEVSLMEPIRLETNDGQGLGQRQRTFAVGLGCLLFGLLLVAGWLQPNPSGLGTHQQLGLPPCTFVAFLGMPCPTCGMTTSWSYFMRGNYSASWAANPGGLLLAIVSATAGCWAFVIAIRGKYTRLIRIEVAWAIAAAITAITLVNWVSRIF